MNSKLEQYVEEISARLHAVPTDEREKEIIEIRQHLEAMIAARAERGENEEKATLDTLGQFGAVKKVSGEIQRSIWRRRLRRMPELTISVLYTMGAIAVTVILVRYIADPLLIATLPKYAEDPIAEFNRVFVMTRHAAIPPFALFGLASLALAFVWDGAGKGMRRLLSQETIAGAATRWILLARLLPLVIRTILYHLLPLQSWVFSDRFASGDRLTQPYMAWMAIAYVLPLAIASVVVFLSSRRKGVAGIALGSGVFFAQNLLQTLVISFQQGWLAWMWIDLFWILCGVAMTQSVAFLGVRKKASL